MLGEITMNNNSGKTFLIIAFTVLAITLISSVAALITIFNDEKDTDTASSTPVQTASDVEFEAPPVTQAPVVTPSPTVTPTEKTINYYVRKAWGDKTSQKGAYQYYDGAVTEANKHSAYTVYDVNGRALYTSPYIEPKDNYYRVKKSWNSTEQEGAFENYEGAVRCANEHPGYTVYSPTGEPLYTSK